jgi:hypothetical protein
MKSRIFLMATAISLMGCYSALADDCSGLDHTTGTVVGGIGGAAVGGVASHNATGAIVGGLVGALAGNAIARSQDCDRQVQYRGRYDRQGDHSQYRGAALRGRGVANDQGQGDENDYWSVESYDDFQSDYRHISDRIDLGHERGYYSARAARRFKQELQQIHYRAERQQQRRRFDPQESKIS